MPEEADVEGEDPRQHVEMAAGVVDTLLNAPNLAPEVQDALVQVGEALLEAGKAEDPSEMSEELVGAMRALAPLAQANLEPDLKEILDELAEYIDAALQGLPSPEAEGPEDTEEQEAPARPPQELTEEAR
jgi:predicted transcriptional regulator